MYTMDNSKFIVSNHEPLKRQEKNASENVVCWSGLPQIIA